MYCVDNSSIISYQILNIMHYRLTVYSVLQGAILYVSKRRHVVLQYFSAMLCIPWGLFGFFTFSLLFYLSLIFCLYLILFSSPFLFLFFFSFLFFSFPFPSPTFFFFFLFSPLPPPPTFSSHNNPIQSNPIQS